MPGSLTQCSRLKRHNFATLFQKLIDYAVTESETVYLLIGNGMFE